MAQDDRGRVWSTWSIGGWDDHPFARAERCRRPSPFHEKLREAGRDHGRPWAADMLMFNEYLRKL